MRQVRGFSLIELLIVVAIILVLAAMAIPNLPRSKMSANEASAVHSLRTINTAQVTYAITYPEVGYADSLTKLRFPAPGDPVTDDSAGLLGTPGVSYEVTAVPAVVGQTGRRGFCSNQVPKVTYDPDGGTNCTTPIQ